MLAFQLKAEPYRDVTDNKPNDTSPSLNNFSRLTSIFSETAFRFARDEVNNFLNSATSTAATATIHHSSSDSTIAAYFDVTDNKTTDTNPSSIFKESLTPRRIMTSENFCREDERLKTFENRWPLTFMDKNILAQTGMYYTGINDNVKCYFCEVEIGRWEVTDHPVNEHMRWSPNCPLLRRRTTNNIPLDAESLNHVLPAPSYDVCGGIETIDIRPGAYAESSISSNHNNNNNNNNGNEISITPTSPGNNGGNGGYVYPDHPEYAIEAARIRSFAEWPRTMKQKPKELSEAGFFYTGTGDRVKCFSCGGGLKDWDESDDPWEQHALWLSNCKYLKLMKGKAYIDSIIAKFKTPQNNSNTTKQEAGNQTEDNVRQNDDDNNSGNGGGGSSIVKQQQEFHVKSINVEVNATSSSSSSSSLAAGGGAVDDETSSEAKKITDEKLCKICYADEYNTAFLPCGHVVACAKCASSVTKCPMCRKPFKDVMRVYFS